MRYLRMLSNSLIGGALAASCLTVLVLQLNPEVPLEVSAVLPLAMTFLFSYGVHVAAVIYAFLVMRQVFSAEGLSPGWVSFRLLIWICSVVTGSVAALMWLNLDGYGVVLPGDAARRMATGAVALSGSAIVLLAIGLVHFSFGRRGSRVGVTLFAMTVVAALSLPLAARGPGIARPDPYSPVPPPVEAFSPGSSPRVSMILLDGASLDFIAEKTSEGKLPNFGRILDSGAQMHMRTVRPTEPVPVWSVVATGKWPAANGIRSEARSRPRGGVHPFDLLPDHTFPHFLVRFGFLTREVPSATELSARPLWRIIGSSGLTAGIVGWPLTHSGGILHGHLVSDRYRASSFPLAQEDPLVYPPAVLSVVRSAADNAADVAEAPGLDEETRALWATDECAADRLFEKVAAALQAHAATSFAAVRYRCLDIAGHHYLRYAVPRLFGDVTEPERRRFGRVLESCYAQVDRAVGEALSSLVTGDLLLIVSGYGMEPAGLASRLFDRAMGNQEVSGSHWAGPDGFLLAYGTPVAPGRRPRAALTDVAPTVLYFLGLPVGRDMQGHARTDIFVPSFTRERPISFIPTYDR
jgi:hypothetical protein